MTSVDLPIPARALAIGAHPDDVEFGCGATLAKWAARGSHCELLVLTDGSKGTWDPGADAHELIVTREREQQRAGEELGVAAVRFARYVDGDLGSTREARERVCEAIRTVRPDVVLGHDPWKQYRLHPDHHVAGRLVVDGIVAARDPSFFPSAGDPHRPSHLLLFEAQVVDHVETVDHDVANAKIRALLAHRSQWRSTMGIDADTADVDVHRDAFVERIHSALAANARDAVGVAIEWAESFKRIDDL